MPESVRFFEQRKFLWDGETYDDDAAAQAKQAEYAGQHFETQLVEDNGKFLLYTRRVVKEVVVEGAPPA